MHKLTLLFFNYAMVNEKLNKNDQKFSMCIATENSYFSPSFNIFSRTFVPIFRLEGLCKICRKINVALIKFHEISQKELNFIYIKD